MTTVDTTTGEIVEFDAAAAERRAERISLRLDTIADNYRAVLPMIRAHEVAEEFRCSARKVTETATANGIGANLGGRAGYRFTETDKLALWEAMRPVVPTAVRRRRRAS